MERFTELSDRDQPTLLARYQELRAEALVKGEQVDTSILEEMVAICGILRRRSGGPPKVARPKALPSLEDL